MAGVKIRSRGEQVFGVFNALFFIIVSIMMLVPFLSVVKDSFDLGGQGDLTITFIPREFTLLYYQMVFEDAGIYRPFINSIGVTVVGTLLALIVNSMAAYTVSKRGLRGNRLFIYFLVVIPIIFHIPNRSVYSLASISPATAGPLLPAA